MLRKIIYNMKPNITKYQNRMDKRYFCIICLDPIGRKEPIYNCGHKFHHKCLLKWNKKCPLCKKNILKVRTSRSLTRYQKLLSEIATENTYAKRLAKICDVFEILYIYNSILLFYHPSFRTTVNNKIFEFNYFINMFNRREDGTFSIKLLGRWETITEKLRRIMVDIEKI